MLSDVKIRRELPEEEIGKAINSFEDAFSLRVVLRGGEKLTIRTVPLGGRVEVRQVAFALGTSVHGKVLSRLRRKFEVSQKFPDTEDGGIGPVEEPDLPLGKVAGIQVELSSGPLEMNDLAQLMVGAISEGLQGGDRAINR